MTYLFKQKLDIYDLVGYEKESHKILLHEPEEYLAALYFHFLNKQNFHVRHVPKIEILEEELVNFKPKVLIFSLDSEQENKLNFFWLLNFRKNFPNTSVITTGFNTNAETLKKLLNVGISSHINRKLSRPQDLVVLIQAVLNN